MPEPEVPNFFDTPGAPFPGEAVEEAAPTPPPAEPVAPAPAAAPAYGQDAVERMAAMAENQRRQEAFYAQQAQASQAWDSLLRPQEKSLSKEDKERLLSDPDALVNYISEERHRNAQVQQALYGALVQSRQESMAVQQASVANATQASLRAYETTQTVAEKLAAEGFDPQAAASAIWEADAALQQDPRTYLAHRTDPAGFEAAARYVIAHKNLRPTSLPQPSVARPGRLAYTPSAPTTSAGERPQFDRGMVESVERALGKKLSQKALQTANAWRSGAA